MKDQKSKSSVKSSFHSLESPQPQPEEKALQTTAKESVDNILENVDVSKQVFYLPAQYEHLFKVAQNIASSSIIPSHFQKNSSNCFIALVRADKMDIDPFWFMEQTYVVHGKLGVQGKLVIALMNKSGIFKGRITFEYQGEGPDRKCTAKGILKDTGDIVSMDCSIALADKNGWLKPKGTEPSKWVTLPDLMLAYRSASFLGNIYCPDVLGGMTIVEENDNFESEEPEEDRGPLFKRKEDEELPPSPETPKEEEVKPEPEPRELKPPEPRELKPIEKILDHIKTKKITRESFNGYLISKKMLKEGEDLLSLSPENVTLVSGNLAFAASSYRTWKKESGKKDPQ